MNRLAQVLEERSTEILQRWVERVRVYVAPGGESHPELQDGLPVFLRQLVSTLRGESRTDRTSPEAGVNPVGREHGAQRFHLGFSLGAVVREYGLFRDVLLDLIEEEQLPVSLGEVRLLTNFVATAIAEAVEEHARQQERARREERTAQDLQLASLFERVPAVVMLVTGPEHRVTLANEACRRLLGTQTVLGRPLRALLPAAEPLFTLLARVRDTRETQRVPEGALLSAPESPQQERFFELVAQPVLDAGGQVESLFLHAQEVTGHVQARRTAEHLRITAEVEHSRLATLIERAPAAIAVLRGPTLVFETLNAETPRIWGRPREELLGRPLLEALPELRGQGFDVLLRGVMATGQPYLGTEIQVPVRRPNGTVETCYFNITYAPWWSEPGTVLGVLVIAMEVTEAVRARRALQAERERAEHARTAVLDALAAQSLVGMAYLRGPEYVYETINSLHAEMLDRDVLGQSVRRTLPEMEAQGFIALLDEVFQTGRPFLARQVPVAVSAGRNHGPRDILADLTYQPVRAQDGSIEGILALVVDVTEQTRLRARAEGERARLSALFQQAPVAIGILRGADVVIEVANPLLCRLWGRTQEQVVGLPAMDALPELRGLGLDDLVRGVLATGKPFVATEMEVHFPRGAGGELQSGYYNFVYDALRDERGAIEGVLLVATEVTDPVRLRQAAERLAQEERTRRDFEQHLIGIVSHDLRNPLSAILLGLQVLLRREGLDARTVQTLVRLHASTERAVRMVRDLLDFTQARLGGGLKLERSPLDLHTLVRGVVEEFQTTHAQRALRLEQQGAGHGRWDGDRVAQMLGNLVANALKYSPPDTPVTVRSRGEAENVWLEVHNGGEPISPDALPRLFQPLQRAVESVDKISRSVGLGLYIVEQIAHAHGGDVQVRSSASEGTTFTVRLPRGP